MRISVKKQGEKYWHVLAILQIQPRKSKTCAINRCFASPNRTPTQFKNKSKYHNHSSNRQWRGGRGGGGGGEAVAPPLTTF